MNILCLGGAGFVGSALIPHLLAASHSVTVCDLMWFGGEQLPLQASTWKNDAADLTASDLEGFNAVIFLAGMSNDPMAEFSPRLNFSYNAALPAYLAHEARIAGVKTFIHAGSCSVYGFDRNVTELTPPKTFSPYGVSKLMGETGCLQQGSDTMRVVAFRMGTVCGPSPRMRLDLIINAMTKDALLKREITVHDGDAERPILDIDDACAAYLHALRNERVAGIYNLASENAAVFEIASVVQKAVSSAINKPVTITLQGKRDVRSYSASTEKAQHAGFVFLRDLEDTVDSTLRMLLNDKRDLEAENFYNIRRFKALQLSTEN